MKWKGRRQSTNVKEDDNSVLGLMGKMAGAAFNSRGSVDWGGPESDGSSLDPKGELGGLAKSQGDAIERMGAEARRNPKPRIPRKRRRPEEKFAKGGMVKAQCRDYPK